MKLQPDFANLFRSPVPASVVKKRSSCLNRVSYRGPKYSFLLPAILYSVSLCSCFELGTIFEKEERKIYIITSLKTEFTTDAATCSPWWPSAIPRTVHLIYYISKPVFGITQKNETHIAGRDNQ
jgi:hypothetical protein